MTKTHPIPQQNPAAASGGAAGLKFLVAAAILTLADPAWAVPPVEVVALFKDRAVVKTADGQAMLKVGETSKSGVALLAADPYGAKVRYRSKVYHLQLSARVGSVFAVPTAKAVHINRDTTGQYRVRGTINGNLVDFLVDTGASIVAISERHAVAMGLDFQNRGRVGQVQTAQGTAPAYFLTLEKVTVGDISLDRVQATVIQGTFPTDVLLGMSFLNQVNMQDNNGVLTLTARY